jgi:hypothetical protein
MRNPSRATGRITIRIACFLQIATENRVSLSCGGPLRRNAAHRSASVRLARWLATLLYLDVAAFVVRKLDT